MILAVARLKRQVKRLSLSMTDAHRYSEHGKERMILALQYWGNGQGGGDEPKALRLARLIADIEPTFRRDCMLVLSRRADCPLSREAQETQLYCGKKFHTMLMQASGEGEGWPAGSNALWRGTFANCAKLIADGVATSSAIFTFEADCVPLSPDWIQRLIEEHARTILFGKRVTGSLTRYPITHINGNLIIEASLFWDQPSLQHCPPNRAWDLWHAATLLSEARPSTIIHNAARSDDWTEGPLISLGRESAILHGCKDDSAYNAIRLILMDPTDLTVDFFLATQPDDYAWLPCLFRSIDRFVIGFRKLVLVIEEQDEPPQKLPAYVELKRCRNYRGTEYPGCSGQNIEGMRAWFYTDADRVWILEACSIFTRHINLQNDTDYPLRRPLLLYTRWGRAGVARNRHKPTREILRFNPPFDILQRQPFVYPRRLLRKVWSYIGGEGHLLLTPRWSLSNVLGNFAFARHPEMFTMVQAESATKAPADDGNSEYEVPGLPSACMRQFCSYSGVEVPEVHTALKALGLK
jgi:hypothetical protein